MSRNLWIGLATVLVGCVGGYVFHMMSDTTATRITLQPTRSVVKPDGDAETSEAIEPLIVEGDCRDMVTPMRRMPVGETLPLARVTMPVGMLLPPRPDVEPGQTLRMPYADEECDWLGVTVDRVLRILQPDLPRLNLFDPTEESESPDVTPVPMTLPTPNYHHQHCPYPGPYRR